MDLAYSLDNPDNLAGGPGQFRSNADMQQDNQHNQHNQPYEVVELFGGHITLSPWQDADDSHDYVVADTVYLLDGYVISKETYDLLRESGHYA